MTNLSTLVVLVITVVLAIAILVYLYGKPVLTGIPAAGYINIIGTVVCLQYIKEYNSKPHTSECERGLYDDIHGYFYTVESNTSNTTTITELQTGTRVAIDGTFTPRLNGPYNTIGTISRATITPIPETQFTTASTTI